MTDQSPAVTTVMLAFGPEPTLVQAVEAVLASRGVQLHLVLVDNGCTSDAVERVRRLSSADIEVITPGTNLGFSGGVNLGAERVRTEFLVLLNSDAIVEPAAVRALVDALVADRQVGIVSGLVRLGGSDGLVNSVGNPLHVLGLSWAGHMNEPVADHQVSGPVASASGALLATTLAHWRRLGGFPTEFFAYQEDLELSWRTWQSGLEVWYVPGAVVDHHYEFSRSPLKMYLVDRNRLLFLLTCHELRTLLLLAPPLLAFDVALLAVAVRQGWGRQWWQARWWVLTHLGWVGRRRRLVQAARRVPDRRLASMMTDTFDPAQVPLPPGSEVVQLLLRGYWRLVRPLV